MLGEGHLIGPPTPLESWWVPVGLAGLTVLVSVGLWWFARRRGATAPVRPGATAPSRRGHPVRVAVVALVGSLLTVLAGVNSYAGYLPSVDALPAMVGHPDAAALNDRTSLPPGPGSTLVKFRLGSTAQRVPASDTYVYLPPGYRTAAGPAQSYPVLYLFGGFPGRNTDWIVAGRLPGLMDQMIAAGEVRPMIVVMPDTTLGGFHDTECLDSVSGPRLETYLSDDLVRYVDGHFRTVPDRTGRAVGGMSSGGFCALNIGLHHLDEYGAIAAMEPYDSPGDGPNRRELAGRSDLIEANTVSAYLPTMDFDHRTAVFLDWAQDASDREIATDRRLATALQARGQTVVTRSEPAGHTWRQAQLAAPHALAFVGRQLTGAGTAA